MIVSRQLRARHRAQAGAVTDPPACRIATPSATQVLRTKGAHLTEKIITQTATAICIDNFTVMMTWFSSPWATCSPGPATGLNLTAKQSLYGAAFGKRHSKPDLVHGRADQKLPYTPLRPPCLLPCSLVPLCRG